MTVTLDATLGGPASNSYIDMAGALAIAQNIPGGGEWSVLDEEVRSLSLIVATRWLETLEYGGDRCSPRSDSSGHVLEPDAMACTSDCAGIPYPILESEVTLAIRYTTDPGLFPGSGSGGGAAAGTYVKRQKLGSLEVEYDQYTGTSVTSCDNCNDPAIITAFPFLKDLLGCWLAGLSGGVGLMLRVRS